MKKTPAHANEPFYVDNFGEVAYLSLSCARKYLALSNTKDYIFGALDV